MKICLALNSYKKSKKIYCFYELNMYNIKRETRDSVSRTNIEKPAFVGGHITIKEKRLNVRWQKSI